MDAAGALRNYFMRHPDPMWIYDLETLAFLEVNPAAVARYGWSRGAFLAMTIADIRPGEDVAALRAKVEAIRAAPPELGVTRAGVWRHVLRSGEIVHVSLTGHRLTYEGRDAELITVSDVTRMVSLQEALRDAAAREERLRREAEAVAEHYRAAFEAAPGRHAVLDPADFTVLAASDSFVEGVGLTRRDVVGRRLFDLFPAAPGDLEAAEAETSLRASLERVAATGRADAMPVLRYPIPTATGGFEERFWSPVNTPLLGPDGAVRYIIHRGEDVTPVVRGAIEVDGGSLAADILLRAAEVRRTVERFADRDADFRMAQKLLRLGVFRASETAAVWDEATRAIYGYGPDETPPGTDAYSEMIHPDDRDAAAEVYRRFAAGASPQLEYRHRIVRRDGGVVVVHGLGERQPDGSICGVVRDVTEEHAAAARAEESDSILRVAGRAAKLGGWRLGLDDDTLFWTPETFALHGREPADGPPTLGDALAHYLPEDRPSVEAALARAAADGAPFDLTARMQPLDGGVLTIRVVGEAERDDAGKVRVLRGAVQDVSEQIAAQRRADDAASRLVATFESISDGFYTLSRDWRITYVNREAERLLRRSRHELLGADVWVAFRNAEGAEFMRELRDVYEAVADDGATRSLTQYYPPLEMWFDVTAYAAPDGLAVYFRDVTGRRRAEEALRVSEERFRILARATNNVIWDWDLAGDTIWWNENLTAVFGWDVAELSGGDATWLQKVHHDDREAVAASLRDAIGGHATNWTEEYRFRKADGGVARVVDRGFILRDAEGAPTRMIGSMIDVTAERDMDERLRQSQKMEAVGQLTGGVAHDFNNLLTIILGNAELLSEQLTDQQQLRLLAEMTATAAERGAELTHRLLAFSRRQALEPKLVEVGALVTGMDGLLRRTLSEEIDIEIVRGGGLWPAEVDPGQLEVALLNLAINARDAMPDGGKLTIETANAQLDQSYADAHEEVNAGQYVMLSVTDTGVGMAADVAARAFEPFFTTKQIGKGSGLGLSMVYGFAKQSGGHAKIYSEPGEGTTVRLYLPRARAGLNARDAPVAEPGVGGGAEHILVVEDDAMVRRHVVGQLRGMGYRVSEAAAGAEALAALERLDDVALLFTDVVMPGGMNGRQLADAALSLRPGLRVLFTSGYTENAIVHQGRLDRGVHLLTKPYRRRDLAAKVRRVLEDE